ncbi:MAG: dehydrogenase E1 component subunit alpha/beta [Bacteroidia bacterium]|nr:dehydrogenase E1 component subunit alpha/beta [Bacteroidia bacterium]
MITANDPVVFQSKGLPDSELLRLYRELLKPRLIEEKMLILLRQGRISKWFSGIGQEAGSVGATLALHPDEYILPMHRNLGVFTARGLPMWKLFAQFQGKKEGYSKGRERSFHFGTNEHHIVGMISHLGPQMGIADGIALATRLKKENKATLVYTGDGGASEGDFHESLNTAAVWDLPVIFLVENNGWGLSTPSSEQFRCAQFIDKALGYGIEAVQVDGNNILSVYREVKRIAEQIRKNPRPVLLELITFRMRGHEEASGTKYVDPKLFEVWGKKDPVTTYESYLMDAGILNAVERDAFRKTITEEIASEVEKCFALPEVMPDTEEEIRDVFCPFVPSGGEIPSGGKEMRLIDAVSDGLSLAMEAHSGLVLMGQDIAEYGGVFKITDGFVKKFGKERVRNTPLCESAIVGAAYGLSVKGMKAMVEMQFADFVSEAMTQICNNLAKSYFRWGQAADVVIRMPTGAGVGAGPFHSQSNEAWFFHTAGLKIAYPAFPEDAKGLLLSAFEDPNPVLFFEHKALYRSVTSLVPEGYYTLPFGKARVVKSGEHCSVITYGLGVHWALQVLDQYPNLSVDLIDLRTLSPLDTETIYSSVKKTGRVLILHEDNLTGGIGAELSALITEHCFESLDAPVIRCCSLDTPVPFAIPLEKNYLALSRLKQDIDRLLAY